MEEITGATIIQEESGRTIEEFVYQNEKYYFKGYLIKTKSGKNINLRGNGFELEEEDKKSMLGAIIINFIVPGGRPSINLITERSDGFSKVLELSQNLVNVLK